MMKKYYKNLLLVLLFISFRNNFMLAQVIQLGPNGSLNATFQHLNQSEIDAMQVPANGLIVFNKTTNCINYFMADRWHELCGTCLPKPNAYEIKNISVNKQDITIVFNKDSIKNKEEIVALLLPDSIVQYTLSNTITFNDVATTGAHHIVYYTKNICGESDKKYSPNFTIEKVDKCNGFEINFNNQLLPIQTLDDRCWTITDISSTANLSANEFYKSSKGDIYYHSKILLNKNVCPQGWHIPNEADVNNLLNYINGNIDRVNKFSAQKTGFYMKNEGGILNFHVNSSYWVYMPNKKMVLVISDMGGILVDISSYNNPFFSIRCVKDE